MFSSLTKKVSDEYCATNGLVCCSQTSLDPVVFSRHSWTGFRSVGQHVCVCVCVTAHAETQKLLRAELMGAVEGVIAVLESKL